MPTQSLTRFVSVLAAGLFCVGAAQAEAADRDKPMNIEADALRYDDAKQTSVFTGNVVLTKGTIIMRGKQIEVQQDAQGNQVGILTGTPAIPGFFRQKREGLDEWIEGEGVRIDYDSKSEIVRFTGNAVLRRYRGTQINDEARGNLIVYNSATEVFTVRGNEPGNDAANPSGRVRAMLTPIPAEGTAAPAPTPAAPANLRPSGQIKEKSQ
ncbi:lipopolysaccharide transport periplasmic protein LptA [Hydrogenophaga sp.]|uniref:lipopolysaccharide transport periplasmic protein LptA n=1 Tax=Hydrogenophaga sp. TaxID=1904254 RepID=UPI002717E5E0|nr:lipopolysaccharide transport periplasmic protein LptA [Hydrogenophaga sp.]MDO8903537.1 lipopolysaccharide transport periplasmic protein LptA [Hydrogenophaga sp.]